MVNVLKARFVLFWWASQPAVCPAGNFFGGARTSVSLHRTVGIEAGSGAGALRKSAGEVCRFAGGQSKLVK
ncbi:MAG: hypothetical protein JXR82_00600 [Marinifilaceae bacterium]|nr:hypothetical protein [Marinifilaceae bacterium]